MGVNTYEEELARWQEAHLQAPTEPGPACELAMLYLEKEEDAWAQQVLAPVLEAHPEHPRANLCMAMALVKEAPERAHVHVEKALRDSDPEGRRQAEALSQLLTEAVRPR